LNNLFKAVKGSTANEKNIACVDLNKFLVRMFSSSLRRNACYSTFYYFKKSLLTPSPDTSLVIEGFSDFLAILSISSI
jgi:hypothetical protein